MKRPVHFTLILLLLLHAPAHAAELVRVTRVDIEETIQIYFAFDKPPKASTTANQRRIDLLFKETTTSPELAFFSPDEHIVKILPRQKKNDFIVSLFFRYQPQKHKLTQGADGKLVLEILPGNEFSKSYQELAERLKGITVLDRLPADQKNPVLLSPYAKNWMSFFSTFENPVNITPPVKFTSPPFPIIRLLPANTQDISEALDAEMVEMAEKNHWNLLEERLRSEIQATADPVRQKLLALTLGETLLHKGTFRDAFIQLHLLKDTYRDEPVGFYAHFLLSHLRAIHESPHIADAEFQGLEDTVGKTPLTPYFLLAQMETALATGQLPRLNKLLLRDDVAYPKPVFEAVQILQANYWYALKQPLKAYAAYQLHKNSPLLATEPFSLAGFCNTLYNQKQYREAGSCYEKLSSLVDDKGLQGLVHYRKSMAKLHYSEGSPLIDDFARIETTFPGTEAGLRATIKKNDLLFLQSKERAKEVFASYQAIAEKAQGRLLREETLFKMALVSAETGESAAAVPLLQQLLKEFQSGDVRISAQALLIQLLPGEIRRLVQGQEYVKALVLARQHKGFFEKNLIDSQFLVDAAEAYSRLGLYDEAQKLYLYLMEILPADQREALYLPMVEAAFNQGNNALVDDLVAQYVYNYPDGKFTSDLTLYRLKALVGDGRLTEALNLLPSPLPADAELYKIAASIYFNLDDYPNCLASLKKLSSIETPLPQKEQFLLAECLFATEALAEAEKEFLLVARENDFYDQSLFRLATLERRKGNEEKALSFLREIVEKGNSPRWKQYAERELQFHSVTKRK